MCAIQKLYEEYTGTAVSDQEAYDLAQMVLGIYYIKHFAEGNEEEN